MTNDSLPSGIYTRIFEIFAIGQGGGFRTNETLIQDVHGDSHYKMITFSHSRVSGQYSKAFIQFTSDGQPGEIIFEMRYYGTQFNQNIKFFFYSRVIWGREDVHFNHAIFDLSESSDNQNILYLENIDMNEKKISGLDDPQNDSDAANIKYVQNVLLLDGSKAMTGNFDMGNKDTLMQIRLYQKVTWFVEEI